MTVKRLDDLIRQYADAYFQHNPVMASVLGVHTYDAELGDFSSANLERRATMLKSLKREVSAAVSSARQVMGCLVMMSAAVLVKL